MIIAVMFACFIALLVVNLPIFLALGGAAVFTMVCATNLPLQLVAQKFFTTFDSFPLMAIPLFMIAGQLMNTSGITARLIELADAIIGRVRGGLAQATILASIFFSGISGAAAVDAAVLGGMLIPSMKRKGYDADFAVVVTASASTIGPIIPPSIMFIIYASITGISVGKLFLAGFIPGLLVGLGLMILTAIVSARKNYPKEPGVALREFVRRLVVTVDALFMPFIIVGGILSGVFTATESGAIATIYGIIVGVLRKRLTLESFIDALYEAAQMTAVAMLIIASAALFSWVLTYHKFPQLITQLLLSISSDRNVLTLLLLILFLIIGLFLDGTSALVILVPVLFPITQQFGYDPIHFAMLMVVTLLIGGLTPPVGILLFICCSIGKIQVKETYRILIPYLIALTVVAFIIAYVPEVTLILPRLFFREG